MIGDDARPRVVPLRFRRKENCPICGEFIFFDPVGQGQDMSIAICPGSGKKPHGRLTLILEK